MNKETFPWEPKKHKTTVIWPEQVVTNPSLWKGLWALAPAVIGFAGTFVVMYLIH